MLHHIRATCEKACDTVNRMELVLLFDPPETARAWDSWTRWRLMPQAQGNLGRRLATCWEALMRASGVGCVFIGADAPEITVQHLSWAAHEIRHSRYAMIPSLDGGYVLLGIPAGGVALFDGISWGTSQVAGQTRRAAAGHGAMLSELPAVHDIDTFADLAALPARLHATQAAADAELCRRLTGIMGPSSQAMGRMPSTGV